VLNHICFPIPQSFDLSKIVDSKTKLENNNKKNLGITNDLLSPLKIQTAFPAGY
jgi:hypothetical protein